jgi:hypothetical protein
MADDPALSLEGALRRLLAEIAVGDYRDRLGQRLTINTAYLEAVTFLELADIFRAERPADPEG